MQEHTLKYSIYKCNSYSFKGKAQFVFLSNPQRTGASRFCITFPQITQKNTN